MKTGHILLLPLISFRSTINLFVLLISSLNSIWDSAQQISQRFYISFQDRIPFHVYLFCYYKPKLNLFCFMCISNFLFHLFSFLTAYQTPDIVEWFCISLPDLVLLDAHFTATISPLCFYCLLIFLSSLNQTYYKDFIFSFHLSPTLYQLWCTIQLFTAPEIIISSTIRIEAMKT